MALHQYRRSAGRSDRREEIIEAEMRGLMNQHPDVDQQTLFDTHRQLEAEFEGESQWFIALTTFAVINALSWLISALVMLESSWPFQTTLPFALFFVGGIKAFLTWQQHRRDPDRQSWFLRLPMRHAVAYIFGSLTLVLASTGRLINHWDADNIFLVWTLVLFTHIVRDVIMIPLADRFSGKAKRTDSAEKPKHAERLALGADGELVPIAEDDVMTDDEALAMARLTD